MTATAISRHLHHVRCNYDTGIWRFTAHVFDRNGVFIQAIDSASASFLQAAADLTRRAIEAYSNDEEVTAS